MRRNKTGCCGNSNHNHDAHSKNTSSHSKDTCRKCSECGCSSCPNVITTDSDYTISSGKSCLNLQVHFVGAGDPNQPNAPANTLTLPPVAVTGSAVTVVAIGSNVNVDAGAAVINGTSLVLQGTALTYFYTANQGDPCAPGTWTDPVFDKDGICISDDVSPSPCDPAPTGCLAIKSPYYVQICRKCGGSKKTCQPTTESDGISLQVHDIGRCIQGTIVLIPGLGANNTLFESQINVLAGQGFRVITITMRGNGDSDQPYTPYNYNVFADDLRQVLDCLDVKNVTLLGESLGSGTALHYAARHCGHRLRNLILVSTPPLNPATMFPSPAGRIFIAGLILAGAQADYPATIAGGIPFGFFPFAPSVAQADVALIESFKARLWAFSAMVQDSNVTSPLASELANDMPNVTVPTLILHGTFDQVTPFPIALALNAGIAGSVLLPDAGSIVPQGHVLNITASAAFNSAVASFAAGGSCS